MSQKVVKSNKSKRVELKNSQLKYKKGVVTNAKGIPNDQIKSASQFQELSSGVVVPSSVGSFKIVSELAVGRCCEVYVGEEISNGAHAAVKVFIRHQQYEGALLRELKFLSKLAPHPHIVTPKCSLQYEGRDILIHELLSVTLKEIIGIHDARPPSVWFISTLAGDLMRGLSHMHRSGVVHGDLKPHNIMWSGEEGTFKLIDFGVSFSLSENMEHAVQSQAYQAPEVIEWNKWVHSKKSTPDKSPVAPPKPGPPIDVWSAGCIVAEVLTGGKVFPFGWEGEDVTEALNIAMRRVEEMREEFLSDIFQWLLGCLKEDCQKRLTAEACEKASFPLTGALERPSVKDLFLLPTTVLRFFHFIPQDVEQSLAFDIIECVVEKASSIRQPISHIFDPGTRSLFIQYNDVEGAERVLHDLTGADVRGYGLVISYFPRRLFDRRMFF